MAALCVHDEDDHASPVPHITFVELPKKWMVNNPQMQKKGAARKKEKSKSVGSVVGGGGGGGDGTSQGDAGAVDDTEAAAAAYKRIITEEEGGGGGGGVRQRTEMELELEAWFVKQGVAVAPPQHFVRVEALFEVFQQQEGHSDDNGEAITTTDATTTTNNNNNASFTLHSFSSCVGKVLNEMFPEGLTRRTGKLSVTCDALPAVAENWPPKRTNKKEKKLAKWGPLVRHHKLE